MAAEHSDYERGTMGVDGHKKTFGGFMGTTVYGGAAIALLVIFPTLVFGANMGWLPALIATLIVGVILGVALKLKGGWYAGMIVSAVPLAIASALIAAIHG
ncbi:aa3-type cytochrome c oxidase subunit IV [Hellea sp.]|nr:aa3-type cytochrome c oxidase subunit IV [Hellea sp.]